MTAERQSDKMASDMGVRMKQRDEIELLPVENKAPINILQHLLNLYEDQIVDVNSLKRWVVCFNSGDSRSSPLVQIFKSVACRLLFITGENA